MPRLGQITMALAVQLLVDSCLKREGPETAADSWHGHGKV